MNAKPPRLVLVATPPRCGSMWLYNAFKQVLRRAGLVAAPNDVQITPHDFEQTLIAAGRNTDERRIFVAKTHDVVGPPQADILVATILRDPRDMALSYRDFVGGAEFDQSLRDRIAAIINTYIQLETIHADSLLAFQYQDVVEQPAAVVGRCRAALALPADVEADRAIAADLKPENVKRIIAKAEADQAIGRPIDRATGFQRGHIRGDGDGAWRDGVPADECERINAEFGGWLKAKGFALV